MIKYFSMDGEFSGLDHTKYDLVSIGFVECKIDNGQFYIDNNRKFYLELKPQHDCFDPESMKINGLNFSNLYKYGSEPQEACRQIIKYLDLGKDDTAVFIGYCGVLDKIYTDQLFLSAKLESPFHYEIIEISSLAIGRLNLEWGFTSSGLDKLLNISPMDELKKHNALEDAIQQAKEFCELMNYKVIKQ